MLTISVIVGPSAGITNVIKLANLAYWPFARLAWRKPLDINVPNFSVRERLAVDRLLPDRSATKIHKVLKLRFAADIAESRSVLAHYIRFARHAPQFVKAHPW